MQASQCCKSRKFLLIAKDATAIQARMIYLSPTKSVNQFILQIPDVFHLPLRQTARIHQKTVLQMFLNPFLLCHLLPTQVKMSRCTCVEHTQLNTIMNERFMDFSTTRWDPIIMTKLFLQSISSSNPSLAGMLHFSQKINCPVNSSSSSLTTSSPTHQD